MYTKSLLLKDARYYLEHIKDEVDYRHQLKSQHMHILILVDQTMPKDICLSVKNVCMPATNQVHVSVKSLGEHHQITTEYNFVIILCAQEADSAYTYMQICEEKKLPTLLVSKSKADLPHLQKEPVYIKALVSENRTFVGERIALWLIRNADYPEVLCSCFPEVARAYTQYYTAKTTLENACVALSPFVKIDFPILTLNQLQLLLRLSYLYRFDTKTTLAAMGFLVLSSFASKKIYQLAKPYIAFGKAGLRIILASCLTCLVGVCSAYIAEHTDANMTK